MSHARKHVISAMVNDYVEPDPAKHEFIVRVVEERGSNQYLVEKPDGEKFLCLRPAKFRNVVFIKRGEYLIVECEPEATNTKYTSKVRSFILHVLYPKQLKYLQSQNLWPAEFQVGEVRVKEVAKLPPQDNDSDNSDDDDLQPNPNNRVVLEEESEDGEDDDDDNEDAD